MGFRVMTVLLAAVLSLGAAAKTDLERKISADHRILVSDRWGGGHRIIFDFNGRKGWIVEPRYGDPETDDQIRQWCSCAKENAR